MTRLITLALALCLMLTTSIFATRVVGQSQQEPNDLKALGYDLCDGKPCFLGIVPGVTTWEQAKPLLDPASINNEQHSAVITRDGRPVGIGSADSRFITEVNRFGMLDIPLAAIIRKFGMPCGVSVYPVQCNTYVSCSGWDYMALFYPSLIVGINIDDYDGNRATPRITPDFPVDSLEIVDPTAFQTQTSPCHIYRPDEIASVQSSWKGFTSIDNYTTGAVWR